MSKTTVFRCPFDSRKYSDKASLYEHMDQKHKHDLNNMSPARVYFNYKYKKTVGKCVMCHSDTKWNETTERYERYCSDRCRKNYRKQFVSRMMKVHDKPMLLGDPEFQKKMLKNRKISGIYKWKDGSKTEYTGTYESDFLLFIEHVLNWQNPGDVMMPAPEAFNYVQNGKTRFYIPDVYITSLNLYIEIKGTNSHYQKMNKPAEMLKDKTMQKNKSINYVKIVDKDYSAFVSFLHRKINGSKSYILKEDIRHSEYRRLSIL